ERRICRSKRLRNLRCSRFDLSEANDEDTCELERVIGFDDLARARHHSLARARQRPDKESEILHARIQEVCRDDALPSRHEAVCPPERWGHSGSNGEGAGWAQNWAQSRKYQIRRRAGSVCNSVRVKGLDGATRRA